MTLTPCLGTRPDAGALLLDVDDALAHVRTGRPVIVGTEDERVLAVPAAVLTPTTHERLAVHGQPTVLVPRALAVRLGVRSGTVGLDPAGPPLLDGTPAAATVAVARALVSPWATRHGFRPDLDGVPIAVVSDRGVTDQRDVPALATELSELAGFGRSTVVVGLGRQPAGPGVGAGELLRAAVRARGPLPVTGPARMPLPQGVFAMFSVREWGGIDQVVLVPAPRPGGPPEARATGPVRVIAACVVGQTVGSARCACRRALDDALADAAVTGAGMVVYVQAPPTGLTGGQCTAEAAPLGPLAAHLVPILVEGIVAAVEAALDAPVGAGARALA